MLEFSHEVNYALQSLSLQTRELFDAVQEAAESVTARITEIKVMRTAVAQATKLHETRMVLSGALPLTSTMDATSTQNHLFSSTVSSTANAFAGTLPGDGAGAHSGGSGFATELTLKLLDDFQTTLRTLQRHALLLNSAHDSFLSTLTTDFRRAGTNPAGSGAVYGRLTGDAATPANGGRPAPSNNANTQGTHQTMIPGTRLVPFPGVVSVSPNSTMNERYALPSIFSNDSRLGSSRGAAPTLNPGSLSKPAGKVSPVLPSPVPPKPLSPNSTRRPPNQSPRAPNDTTKATAGPSFLRDRDSASVIASAFYFSFDALMRTLKAREGTVFVQRNVEECQGVCVFGPKPRHPSSVVVNLRSGMLGAVIKSGIALNIASEDRTGGSAAAHMICVPIFESTNRIQPIGALQVSRSEPSAFSEAEVAIAHQWTVCASQFILGYGVDLVTDPFDPLQTILRPGGPLSESLKRRSEVPKATRPDWDLSALRAGSTSVSEGITSLLTDAMYDNKLAIRIATQIPPQLVLASAHKNHSANFRPADLKGQVELLRYQNITDVAAYIQRLDDTWRRSADHLQGMELEQIHQMQDVKQGQRKLKTVSQQLDKAHQQARDYREKYEVLKKELSSMASD